jgi:hypothetical protein
MSFMKGRSPGDRLGFRARPSRHERCCAQNELGDLLAAKAIRESTSQSAPLTMLSEHLPDPTRGRIDSPMRRVRDSKNRFSVGQGLKCGFSRRPQRRALNRGSTCWSQFRQRQWTSADHITPYFIVFGILTAICRKQQISLIDPRTPDKRRRGQIRCRLAGNSHGVRCGAD